MRSLTIAKALALSFLAGTLAACASEPQPHSFGVPYPMLATAVVMDSMASKWSLIPEVIEPDPEPRYAKLPPCVHPGDEKKMHLDGTPRCSRTREADVAYWTARPDKHRLACKGMKTAEAADYCNEATGMVPHCHGFGKFRFCHSHPGGNYPHDHMHDQEFASNATPEPTR